MDLNDARDVWREMVDRGEQRTGYVGWFWCRAYDLECAVGGARAALDLRRGLRARAAVAAAVAEWKS